MSAAPAVPSPSSWKVTPCHHLPRINAFRSNKKIRIRWDTYSGSTRARNLPKNTLVGRRGRRPISLRCALSRLARLYGPAARCKPKMMIGGKLVLRFCIRPIAGAVELLAIMDIRALSISFTSRPRRPYGPPDHECAGETFSPSPLSELQTSAGKPTLAFGINLSSQRSP